nr:immunoglobulin heavy chain junction region [Mus musculus]NSM05768.1 immunoglobulin heavy chain junction region [Mus musculus]NSM08150.1 immunoglobulin heavy chain junction region [Mus musculus]
CMRYGNYWYFDVW